jgi:proline iminopeptidase
LRSFAASPFSTDVSSVNEALGFPTHLRAQLRNLSRPVLIVQGQQDPIGDRTAEDLHDVMPGSKHRYVAKAGHYPWLEQPDAFREIIREFLKDWAPDKSK